MSVTVPTAWIVFPLLLIFLAAWGVACWIAVSWVVRRIGDMYLRRNGYYSREHFEQVMRDFKAECDEIRRRPLSAQSDDPTDYTGLFDYSDD